MKAVYPIHSIEQFTHSTIESGLYIERLSESLINEERFQRLHKHDFYFVLFVTDGKGKHEIDFKSYTIRAGSVFFMSPGQLHRLIGRNEGVGFMLFHTRDFYEVAFNHRNIRDYPFYFCNNNPPYMNLSSDKMNEVVPYLEDLYDEYRNDKPGRYQKCCSLIELIYITLSRQYQNIHHNAHLSPGTPNKIQLLEDLIEQHYARLKSPADYARLLKTTTRQLNRMCHDAFGKTTSELIIDRVLLEAKRLLLHQDKNVAEVAEEVGYFDTGYFTRLFRKKTGLTPSSFARKYSSVMEEV